ncbi:MAG: ECF transporter S component [Gemmiger sp.]
MNQTFGNTRRLTQLALLVALELVMAYTPLGYLQVGPLSMSLLTIPVAIGAMLLGPAAGLLMGTVFGLTSFLQAMQGTSAMGAALFALSPAGSFVVCVIARVLMGLVCALLFQAAQKLLPGKDKLACAVGGLAAPMFNTVFFMGFLVLLFYNSDYVQGQVAKLGVSNPLAFIVALVGVQALVEWVSCCVVATAVTVPLRRFLKTR